MDLASLIQIAIVVAVVYFFVKFIVSPVIKVIVGIIIFLILIYLMQKFLGFDINNVLSSFGLSISTNSWNILPNWLLTPTNYYLDQAKDLLDPLMENIPKISK